MSEQRQKHASIHEKNPKAKQPSIWQEIIKDSMHKKDMEDTNIFIFGDKITGKKSLFRMLSKEISDDENTAALNIDENASKYGIINYTYLNIRKLTEEDAENLGKMSVWIMNNLITKDTFLSLVKKEYITKSLCVIMVDLSRPWLIKDSIEKWANFIYDTFSALILKFPFEKQKELRDNGK